MKKITPERMYEAVKKANEMYANELEVQISELKAEISVLKYEKKVLENYIEHQLNSKNPPKYFDKNKL